MGQIHLRHLPDHILERLRREAAQRHVDVEDLVTEILAREVGLDPLSNESMLAELARCRALTPAGHRAPAEELIREDRDTR